MGMDARTSEVPLSGIVVAALGLACGGCVGWTFALAVDLALPAKAELSFFPLEARSVWSTPPDPRSVSGY